MSSSTTDSPSHLLSFKGKFVFNLDDIPRRYVLNSCNSPPDTLYGISDGSIVCNTVPLTPPIRLKPRLFKLEDVIEATISVAQVLVDCVTYL